MLNMFLNSITTNILSGIVRQKRGSYFEPTSNCIILSIREDKLMVSINDGSYPIRINEEFVYQNCPYFAIYFDNLKSIRKGNLYTYDFFLSLFNLSIFPITSLLIFPISSFIYGYGFDFIKLEHFIDIIDTLFIDTVSSPLGLFGLLRFYIKTWLFCIEEDLFTKNRRKNINLLNLFNPFFWGPYLKTKLKHPSDIPSNFIVNRNTLMICVGKVANFPSSIFPSSQSPQRSASAQLDNFI